MVRKLLFAIALGMLVLVLTNCRPEKGSEPDPRDVALESLSGTWKVGQVTYDGVIQAGYQNFALTISGTKGAASFGYACTGRPTLGPWRSSGAWTFGNNFQFDIKRDPDTPSALDIAYAVTGDQLELTFNYQGAGESRTSGVIGTWVFKLNKR